VSYLRSVHLQKDKSVFELGALPFQRFAESLGLPGAPKVKFLPRESAHAKLKLAPKDEVMKKAKEGTEEIDHSDGGTEQSGEDSDAESSSDGEEETGEEGKETITFNAPTKPSKVTSYELHVLFRMADDSLLQSTAVRTKYDRMFERKNQNILSEHYTKLIDHEHLGGGSLSDPEDFITLKRADHGLDDNSDADDPVDAETFSANLSKRKQKLGKAKQAILTGGMSKKLVFDEDGQGREVYGVADGEEWIKQKGGEKGVMDEGRRYAEGERGRMKEVEGRDKEEAREKKREKKRKRKEREKEATGTGQVSKVCLCWGGSP
jgi:ATP-dependent RNA helicase DDX10/DBP4